MASKTKTSDPEANKAIALRLAEVFNGRRLDLLEDVLHAKFRGRGLSAFPPSSPEVGPVLGESSMRCSIKQSPMREPRCSTLSQKATRS